MKTSALKKIPSLIITMQVGAGVSINENDMLRYLDDHTFIQSLHAVLFKTNDAKDGQWLIPRDAGKTDWTG